MHQREKTQKKNVKEAILIENFGIEDDAHAGDWHHCEIFHQVGDCIMPREGVFTKVIKGGKISVGDEFVIK